MEHRFILLLGGTGFLGRHLLNRLSGGIHRVVVPTRLYQRTRELQQLAAVDAVVEADIHDDATLARLVSGMDAVINLVGILHSRPARKGQPYGPDFARAHVDLPRRVVAACAAAGVPRYLHMSAMGAGDQAPSMYLRSKAAGEHAAFSHPAVGATAFRPSVMFGEDDQFLNLFAAMQKFLPFVPLAGADARFQPVYVGDIAQAMARALEDDHTIGHTYELGGPAVYSLRELVELAGSYSGHKRPVIGLPDWLGRLQAAIMEHLPGTPLMSRDNLDSMKIDNIASADMWPALGLIPTELDAVAPFYLASAVSAGEQKPE
jgi:NADH dehydrogenase